MTNVNLNISNSPRKPTPSSPPHRMPVNPFFSSGPCRKHPGWSLNKIDTSTCGRTHRSHTCQRKIAEAITRTKKILSLPPGYRLAIIPGSATGAMEAALWSLLGPRGINALVWDEFSSRWSNDITDQLKLDDVKIMQSPYGELPELDQIDNSRDTVFVWNGTSSGTMLPNGDWIDPNRSGLTICDATSIIFAANLPFYKLDVITFSWQKALGGEGAHGMIILSPRAIERLETYQPPWPVPRILRISKNQQLIDRLFIDATINTPSMLCLQDYLVCLDWVEAEGGVDGLTKRSQQNAAIIYNWIENSTWADCLTKRPSTRSHTSVCMQLKPGIAPDEAMAKRIITHITDILEDYSVAFDIKSHVDAPLGLRIWTGPTIPSSDIELLLPWLDWAFATATR